MQQTEIIIRQILILSLLGVTGFISGKTRYLPENTGVVLSQIVIRITAPFMIFTTMISYSFTAQDLKNGMWTYGLGILFIFFSFGVGFAVTKLVKLEGASENVYFMQHMFGNTMYLAFPLLLALFDQKGVIYAVFYVLANDTLLWTFGIYLVSRHQKGSIKENLKHLVNGNTIAFVLGIIAVATNLQQYIHKFPKVNGVYSVLFDAFNPLGKSTVYLSMLFIGLILSEVKIDSVKDFIKRYPLFILSLAKLLIIPAVALLLLTLAGSLIDPFVKSIVVIELAMPCGTITAALAAQYKSDYRLATEGVFITTLFSMITLPLIIALLHMH